jgi:hypothetical protein
MATKLEEANIAPASNPILAEGASSEKQPDPAPAAESSEKKVETATEGLGDLSLAENEKTTQEPKEEVVQPAAPSAPVTTATPAAPTTEAVQPVTEIEAPTKETAPTTEPAAPTTGPVWPETAADHPLTKFYDIFEDLVKESEHNEVYGIQLSKSNPFHTKLILQKFLRANGNDLDKAKQQLLETLKWRKDFNPVKAASETFNKTRFDGLGYVLEVGGVPESKNAKDIVTFNIYGAVKDKKATFGDLEGYASTFPRPNTMLTTHPQLPPLACRPHGEVRPKTRPLHRHVPDPQLRRRPRPLPGLPGARLPPSLVPAPRPRRQDRDDKDNRGAGQVLPRDAVAQVLRQRAAHHGLDVHRRQVDCGQGDGEEVRSAELWQGVG